MHLRNAIRFLVVVALAVTAVMFFTKEPVRGIDLGASRLVSSEPFPEAATEACTWEVAAPEPSAYQRQRGAGAGGEAREPAIDRKSVV